MSFFALTIAAERLELSRLAPTPRWASRAVVGISVIVALAAAAARSPRGPLVSPLRRRAGGARGVAALVRSRAPHRSGGRAPPLHRRGGSGRCRVDARERRHPRLHHRSSRRRQLRPRAARGVRGLRPVDGLRARADHPPRGRAYRDPGAAPRARRTSPSSRPSCPRARERTPRAPPRSSLALRLAGHRHARPSGASSREQHRRPQRRRPGLGAGSRREALALVDELLRRRRCAGAARSRGTRRARASRRAGR
jgi:hypothetical protein